jgi:hypothetical protein
MVAIAEADPEKNWRSLALEKTTARRRRIWSGGSGAAKLQLVRIKWFSGPQSRSLSVLRGRENRAGRAREESHEDLRTTRARRSGVMHPASGHGVKVSSNRRKLSSALQPLASDGSTRV